jgi:hypothetical protein
MRELSPRARSLIQRMQGTDGPSSTDHERMRARLTPLLTAGSIVAAATTSAAAAAAGTAAPLSTATGAAGLSGTLAAAKLSVGHLMLWGALGLGVASTITAATVVLRPPPRVAPPAASAEAAAARPRHGALGQVSARTIEPEFRTEATSGPTAAAPAASVHSNRTVQATGPASTLAEETRLLRAAQTARREGNDSFALTLLEEHATRFPSGVLRVERSVTQALALCAQGQAVASNRLREQILREAPSLPASSRIRERCAER